MEVSFFYCIFVIEIRTTTKTITTMTVKELMEILKNIAENAYVFCWDNSGGGYTLTDVEYDETRNQVELS